MKKRFSAFLLAVLMVAALLPAVSMATAHTAGDETALRAAVAAAGVGDTVKLTGNVVLASTIKIENGKEFTLDLNGYEISFDETQWTYGAANDGAGVLTVCYGGQLTIDDSSSAKTGTVKANCNTKPVSQSGNRDILPAVILTHKDDNAANGTARLIVNGGTLIGDAYAITGNKDRDDTYVEINGGKIISENTVELTDCAIYWPQNGTLVVNGGHIEADCGIFMASGKLVIPADSTAVVKGVSDKAEEWKPTLNGYYCTGEALSVENRYYEGSSYEAPVIQVEGGKFVSTKNAAVGSYAYYNHKDPDNSATKAQLLTGFVSGGQFQGAVAMTEGLLTEGVVLGSDGTVAPPAYAGPVMNWVKVSAADNGVVKSGPLAASAGATVTLYPKAAEGYVLDTVSVLDAEGNTVALDGLKFQIPAGGVTVSATFKPAE